MGLGYLHITAWSLLLNPVSWARPKALNSGASNDKDSRFSFCPNQSNCAISESMAVKASDPKYMEKLRMKSLDAVEGNVAKIAALFPHCVTERLNKDGKPELAIDFDKLRAELSADALDTGEERYQFTWPDKRAASRLANTPTDKTLRPDVDASVNFWNTKNLYIEGDNLDVLKVLRENYLGKVKMIYIDPPYNTGNDFVYNDDFAQGKEDFEATSGLFDEEGNQVLDPMQRNTERNGRFHTDWLNMIYPRLKVARDLLSDDGVIFISIDNNEITNLQKIADEIFGSPNYIGTLVLKTATDNNPSQINTEHEYMLCYAKNKIFQSNWSRQGEAASKIIDQYQILKSRGLNNTEVQNALRVWIKNNKTSLPQVAHYNNVDDKGVYSSSSNSSNPHPGGYMFDIIHPVTGGICPKPANGWRWPKTTFDAYDKAGEIEWGKDHTTQPHVKKRIETSVEYLRSIIYEDNRSTTKMLSDLFEGKKVFENPKPLSVISRIIEYVSDKDSYILDFFSGSATTAHAVMKLNAEDGGHRKFIMVQLPEVTDEKSAARKAGYETICEIGKERILRAGNKIKEESYLTLPFSDIKVNDLKNAGIACANQAIDMQNAITKVISHISEGLFEENPKEIPYIPYIKDIRQDLDIGFRVLKLDSSNMEDVFYTPEEFSEQNLFNTVDNVKPDRTPLDLLFQMMPELDIELSAKIEEREIDGKKVFFVDDTYLIATFDIEVNESTVTEIAKMRPQYFVMRDASAANDNVLDNFEQIFKHYSPDTNRKIL